MTRPTIDDVITTDLMELAASHQHPRAAVAGAFRAAPVELSRSSHVARWCAQVAALADNATPVYAHGRARAVTGGFAVLAAAIGAIGMSEDRGVVEPGGIIVVVTFLLACVYALVYAVAGARFGRAARKVRLDDRPDGPSALTEWTQRRIARVDRWATGLTVAGLVTLLPMFGYCLGGSMVYVAHDEHRVADLVIGGDLALTAALALLPAVLLGWSVNRPHLGRRTPGWVAWLERGRTAVIGLVVTGGVLFASSRWAGALGQGDLPSASDRFALAVAAQVAVVLIASWVALRLRRLDHDRVGLGKL